MKTQLLAGCMALFVAATLNAQTGKYFTATGGKCKNAKVYIDGRITEYSRSAVTVVWTGGCKESFADGEGKLTVVCKEPGRFFTMEYEGTLRKGKKEGNAILNFYQSYPVFNPAYSYNGSFKNDEFDGYGEFGSKVKYPASKEDIERNTDLSITYRLDMMAWRTDLYFYEYKGDFSKGKIADTENGKGTTRRMPWIAEEVGYTGAIKNGKPNGKGIAVENFTPLANEEFPYSVTGNFINGILNGYGKQTGRDAEYEGEFLNGNREGKGKMTVYGYNGAWQSLRDKNLPAGRNISFILEGNFKNGEAEGFFTIYFQNSAAYKYTGPMQKGLPEGTGEIEYIDGSKFRGNFRAGKKEGEGSVSFADGDKFSGEYKDDAPVNGTFFYTNGTKYEGGIAVRQTLQNNKTINTYIKQGRGIITYGDGTRKEVNCVNDECN